MDRVDTVVLIELINQIRSVVPGSIERVYRQRSNATIAMGDRRELLKVENQVELRGQCRRIDERRDRCDNREEKRESMGWAWRYRAWIAQRQPSAQSGHQIPSSWRAGRGDRHMRFSEKKVTHAEITPSMKLKQIKIK